MTTIILVAKDASETDTVTIIVSDTDKKATAKNAEVFNEGEKFGYLVYEISAFFIKLTEDVKRDNEYRGAHYLSTQQIISAPALFIRERLSHFFYALTHDLKIDNKYRL